MRRAAKFAVSLALVLPTAGCRNDEPLQIDAAPSPQREQVAAGTADDVRPVHERGYARSLVEQLDLIPPDADGYLVIRDLRPVIEQARRVEQVMAGPLARAIPALAKLGGGTGEARLVQLQQAHDTLELLLAGLEASGVVLDRGVVVALGGRAPLVVFAAADLQKLSLLAGLIGEGALTERCGELAEQAGYFVCSLGDVEALKAYEPAGQGKVLAKRLADRLGAGDAPVRDPRSGGGSEVDLEGLESINVVLSLAGDRSFDVGLRTDAGLWELSMPLPKAAAAGEQLLSTGPAPALRAMAPGSSFAWARVDAEALAKDLPDTGPISAKMLTGEAWFGAVDGPDGLVAQLGHHDPTAATYAVSTLATLLPENEIAPEALGGLRLALDRASIEIAGEKVPTFGMRAVGEQANAWAETLGVEPRARVWANRDYLSLALGEDRAIPGALDRLEGSGPSKQAIASLPPTLARALLAGEVGLLVHMVLDHWQAPPSEAELQALFGGLPAEQRPSALAITNAFQTLAPWSSVDVWLSRAGASSPWLLHVTLVPFVAEGGEGVGGGGEQEQRAALAVLASVLAGGDGTAGYRELLTSYPKSPRATAYRARVGDAPEHHAAASMVMLGALAAVVVPAIETYLRRAKSSEAPAQTQVIASAALAVVERDGCKALLGEAGPTPPLALACSEGCSAGEHDGYPSTAWSDDPIWQKLGVNMGPRPLRFHYQFSAKANEKGGGCELRTIALGDADADGKRATYERVATVDAEGRAQLEPMRIVDAGE